MGYLLANDGLNGKAGSAFMVHNGQNIELFGIKKFNFDAEVQTSDFPVVGALVDQTKVKGLKYSGSLPIYAGTPAFEKVISEYKRTGRWPDINFQVTNNDKGSSVGTQVVAIYGVTFTKVPLAMLDDSTDYLQEEITFAARDYEPLQSFNDKPSALG